MKTKILDLCKQLKKLKDTIDKSEQDWILIEKDLLFKLNDLIEKEPNQKVLIAKIKKEIDIHNKNKNKIEEQKDLFITQIEGINSLMEKNLNKEEIKELLIEIRKIINY